MRHSPAGAEGSVGGKDGKFGMPPRPKDLLGDDAQRTVSRLLGRMRQSAFQGRKLGEAFEVWRRMIDGGPLIALGLAGSLASAALTPLVRWLVERGYVDLITATSANATEDLLESRGVPF